MLTACAVGAPDPNQVSNTEKAKNFTEVAIEYLKSGDYNNARSWLQKAIGYDENYGRAYSVLATVFQSEKEFELAEKFFKKSISVEPKSAMLHNNYGAFLYQQKKYTLACAELEIATKDPFYNLRANALNNLGRCYDALKDEKKASEAFQRSVNLGGRNAFALLNLAKKLLNSGEIFKSNAKYSEFLQLVTENKARHSADSLILGIRLARESGDTSSVVAYSLLLENLYPKKYKKFKESFQ
jgi:type IV pilus assembly protein PilF